MNRPTDKSEMTIHRIYGMAFGKVFPLYIQKAKRKNRTESEVLSILEWLTGYDSDSIGHHCEKGTTFEQFFLDAPALNPRRMAVHGNICGVRVEEIGEPLMREIRILDKLVDELARGKSLEKILNP